MLNILSSLKIRNSDKKCILYALCLNKNKKHFYVFKATIESPRFLTTGNANSVWSAIIMVIPKRYMVTMKARYSPGNRKCQAFTETCRKHFTAGIMTSPQLHTPIAHLSFVFRAHC